MQIIKEFTEGLLGWYDVAASSLIP